MAKFKFGDVVRYRGGESDYTEQDLATGSVGVVTSDRCKGGLHWVTFFGYTDRHLLFEHHLEKVDA